MSNGRIIFITGTDTGVGKTILTALLLARLRAAGQNALAIKPFCSGLRRDPALLHALQGRQLSLEEVNPFHFREPVAPLITARRLKTQVTIDEAVKFIKSTAERCQLLLVEGVGGLLVPLGEGYSVLDLILHLHPHTVMVVVRNKLGMLNHTMLTVGALGAAGIHDLKVVLMHTRARDLAARTNPQMLSEMLAPTPLFCVPFLGAKAATAVSIRSHSARLRKVLEAILK